MDGRLTIWTLQDQGKGWRVYAIRFSRVNVGCNGVPERTKTYLGSCKRFKGGCWDTQKHRNGIRLTDSRIDRTLREYCEGTRA